MQGFLNAREAKQLNKLALFFLRSCGDRGSFYNFPDNSRTTTTNLPSILTSFRVRNLYMCQKLQYIYGSIFFSVRNYI